MVNVDIKLQVWVGSINSAAYNFYFLFAICQEGVTTCMAKATPANGRGHSNVWGIRRHT